MTEKGLDPEKLEIVDIAPSARANMLLTRQIPAIEFFVMSEPGLKAAAATVHAELDTFLLADHGLDLYSLGIAGTDSFIAGNQDRASALSASPSRMATCSRRSREGGREPEAIRPDAEREGHRRRDRDRARPRRHAGDEEERPRLVDPARID